MKRIRGRMSSVYVKAYASSQPGSCRCGKSRERRNVRRLLRRHLSLAFQMQSLPCIVDRQQHMDCIIFFSSFSKLDRGYNATGFARQSSTSGFRVDTTAFNIPRTLCLLPARVRNNGTYDHLEATGSSRRRKNCCSSGAGQRC